MTSMFTGEPKQVCREHQLQVVCGNHFLFNRRRTRLRGDWLELMGESGFMQFQLLESRGVVRRETESHPHRGIVFVDRSRELVDAARQKNPEYKYFGGELSLLVPQIQKVIKGPAVLGLDTQDGVGCGTSIALLRSIRPLIDQGVERFQSCTLLFNCVLTGRYTELTPDTVAQRLRRHVEDVINVLDGYNPKGGVVIRDPYRLLPKGAEFDLQREKTYTGPCGAFWIYKGKNCRMADLCVNL